MLRFLFTILPFILLNTLLSAQNPGCDGSRYKQPVFTAVKKTTVPYATTLSHVGQNMTLSMDVYEPTGDTTSRRPVVVLAHGGSFIFGDKGDMKTWCELLARRGYVVASIQYRLFPVFIFGFPDSTQIMDTAVKAVGDMKAGGAVFPAGCRDGQSISRRPGFYFYRRLFGRRSRCFAHRIPGCRRYYSGLYSGPGQCERGLERPQRQCRQPVLFVKSWRGDQYVGRVVPPRFIRDGELPLLSVHSTADQTVPFQSGLAANLAYLEGSGLLHAQALEVGTWSFLKKVPGGGHTNIYDQGPYTAQIDNYWLRATALLEFLTCRADTLPGFVSGAAETLQEDAFEWAIYPNPARQTDPAVFVQLPETLPAVGAVLFDGAGREIRRVGQALRGQARIPVTGLPAALGCILWKATTGGVYWALKCCY